ncbi:hypothetical protein LSCM1_04869 [Leishmania martiniquensis]|uniref:Uncharacterized protein n=1 Tax=Leishmania martiniquensis TaxID=1580590 RepID=A0A836KZ77_9TRYP|nr:hypothetical protein LSCM1_04869 [Leishmania martiniquensis]
MRAMEDRSVKALDAVRIPSAPSASAAEAAAADNKESTINFRCRRFVLDVNHENWHLLDGDLLIPGDGKNAGHLRPQRGSPRKGALEVGSSPSRAAETRTEVDLHLPLAGDYRSTVRHAHDISSHQPDYAIAEATSADAATSSAEAEPSRITLTSLRLLILLGDEAVDEEESPEGHRHRRWCARSSDARRRQGFSAPSGQPGAGARRRGTTPNPVTVPAAVELEAMERCCDGGDAARISADATRASVIQTEEELWRRCLVASTRDSKGALTAALKKGKSRSDCLIVEVDVGNCIPSSSKAKGHAAILSLLLSILFVSFLSLSLS